MPIRAVYLDIGGVLIRVEDHNKRHEWEARLGLQRGQVTRAVFDSEEAARAMRGEILESEMWQSVGHRLGLSDVQVEEFQKDFFAGECFDADLAQFVASLRPRYKTGIISNAWSDARPILNRKFNLDGYVDAAIYSAEVRLAKPDARIYQLALDRLSVRPGEAAFVDDMPENVEAARKLGMCGVQFQSTAQTIADVKRCLGE
jgi:putative hydrolase of the HAD superfamily